MGRRRYLRLCVPLHQQISSLDTWPVRDHAPAVFAVPDVVINGYSHHWEDAGSGEPLIAVHT